MIIDRIILRAGVSREYLQVLADSASRRYKIYQIDKRNGGKRTIAHPAKNLKSLQRWLSRVVFSRFPTHERATAYVKGSGILKNASFHERSNFTIRLDFRRFFESFTIIAIAAFLKKNASLVGLDLDEADIDFICKIVTKDGSLTIGAPSSPSITNIMMYEFDCLLHGYCEAAGLIYTRYADDIFISSFEANKLDVVPAVVNGFLKSTFGDMLVFNQSKFCSLSRRYRRTIAGLFITSDRKISIGRSRKREIKSLVFKFSRTGVSHETLGRLAGLIAYCMDVEPQFVLALQRKYGEETLNRIRTAMLKAN